MKICMNLLLILFISFPMSSQSIKDKIAQRKAMVEKAKKNNISDKINSKDLKKLEELSSTTFSLMNFLKRTESLEETKTFYKGVDANTFDEFTKLYQQLKESGIQSNALNNYTNTVTKRLPDFLKTKASGILKLKYNEVEQQLQAVKGYYSEVQYKEKSLELWQILAVHTKFFSKYKNYDPGLETIHNNVSAQVSKLGQTIEDDYAHNLSTSMHKELRENVVLSYKPIVYGKENKADFLDHITIDETNTGLYFMFYNSVPNQTYLKARNGKKGRYVHAQLQFGGDIGSRIFNGCLVFYDKAYDLTDAEEKQSYLALPVFPSTEDYKRDKWLDPTYYRFIQCLLEKAPNTAHRARLIFGFPGTSKEFSKDFQITITEAGRKQLLKTKELIDYEKLKEVKMGNPGGAHNDTNIAIVKADAAKKGFNVKRIVITGDRFKVYKDSNYPYAIKNKACNAELAFEKDGKCYVYEFQIVQEYQGGGTYGEPFCAFAWGGKHQILCENITN